MMQTHRQEFEEDSPGLSLRDLYFTLFRHRRLIGGVAGAVALLSVLIALFMIKQTYESSANLLVRTGRESMAGNPTMGLVEQMRLRSRDEEIRTEMEIIKSREVIDGVVGSLGIEFFIKNSPPGPLTTAKKFLSRFGTAIAAGSSDSAQVEQQKLRDRLLDDLTDRIEVEQAKTSSIFRVSFQGPSPEFAQEFLNRLIAVYMEKHSSMYFTDSAYTFLNDRTDKLRRELELVENEIKDYKNSAGSSIIQEQRFLDQFATLQQDVRDTESQLAASQARAKLFTSRLGSLPAGQAGGAGADMSGIAADELYRRLSALRVKEQELLSTFTEKSIPVQETRRQIREIQGMLPSTGARPGMSALISPQTRDGLQLELIAEEGMVSSLQARLEVQREKLGLLKDQFKDVNDKTLALVKMERRRGALEESYKKFSQSLQQARIDQSLKLEKISNITIAQQPTYSLQPLKTKKLAVLAVGFIGGLLVAMALAFVLENMDHTIKKPEDVPRLLDIPFLASLPRMQDIPSLMPELKTLPNITTLPARRQTGVTLAPERTNSLVIKYFDALLHRLVFSEKHEQGVPHIIAVTSARQGEGVSTVAANLAVRLARLGSGQVLLVDMNLMNLDQQQGREHGKYPALGNMMALQAQKATGRLPEELIDRLYLIQYGGKDRTPTEISELQTLWRKDYEFVVIDVPPVLSNGSAAFLARLADKVILVIEAERERHQVIRRARQMLEEAHANVIGAILNKRNLYIPQWLYRRL